MYNKTENKEKKHFHINCLCFSSKKNTDKRLLILCSL